MKKAAKKVTFIVLARNEPQAKAYIKSAYSEQIEHVYAESADHVRGYTIGPKDYTELPGFRERPDAALIWEALQLCMKSKKPDNILESKASIEEATMTLCKQWAFMRSKDPSTKVGAALYDPKTGGLWFGYNGFPPEVPDEEAIWKRRQDDGKDVDEYELTKYDLVIHAEVNAMRKALLGGVDLSKCTLICTHLPCPRCFKDVVLANDIRRVVYGSAEYPSNSERDRWLIGKLAELGGVALVKADDE